MAHPARSRCESRDGWHADRQEILARYLELLQASNSPLLEAGAEVLEQVTLQLMAVADAVASQLRLYATLRAGAFDVNEPSESIGRSRADARIHSSHSLNAASLIFEASLPILTARYAAAHGDSTATQTATETVAVALNREILQRMASAARAYVDCLLATSERANRDERRRLSRELHDVAAPAVAIGLQNLELYDVYVADDPAKASVKITAAKDALRDALATIRSLSAESRENVASRGLAAALRDYLTSVSADIRVSFVASGDLGRMALACAEELFLIVREGVRNAVTHGAPGTIEVRVRVGPTAVIAEVVDDGRGFDVASLPRLRHVGMAAMQERADLLGAVLTLDSSPGAGTRLTVNVPLPVEADPPQ